MSADPTVTEELTLAKALSEANPNRLSNALHKVDLGQVFTPQKKTVSQAAAATITLSPPALSVPMVRVTAGAAAAGPRIVTDAGGTPSATVCTLSDDGATLTFEGNVTGAVIGAYIPRSAADVTAKFNA